MDASEWTHCMFVSSLGPQHLALKQKILPDASFQRSDLLQMIISQHIYEGFGLTITRRPPVVLRPPKNIIVVLVLLLQPINKRLKVLHQWLGTHFWLASDHGHSLWPGLTGT